jgi:cellulose synthase/poly-beta-1,6-N-acetylglucosamine synthase-like glycosyltransferase
MTPGLVSVVVCAYNNWPDVEMTIASALQQSFQPLEVIVVDNSSTDATSEEVPKRFGGRVRYVRQPNRECAGAHNTGFALASGEFIQFVAGDDVLSPNKIARQVELFRARPDLDIVYGDIRMFQTPGGVAHWSDVPTQQEHDMLSALLLRENLGAGINVLGALFRRRALEKVGPWDESLYCEDTDYWLRAAWAGCRFGHCPGAPMGFKRMWPGQKIADTVATTRGLEAVWDKALGYVTREPYHSLIAERLAELRFHMAVSRFQMARVEALATLARARAASSAKVSALTYAFGYAAIVLPWGSVLVRSRGLRPVRRFLAGLCRYAIPR